jgi:formylglycine-generating enzyme required for sulfatase activity
LDPENPRWKDVAGPVAARLVHENPLLLGQWRDIYRRVGWSLFGPLLEFYYDRHQREERAVAEGFLLDFAARPDNLSRPEDYADLIVDADPERFEQLLAILMAHPDRRRPIDRLLTSVNRQNAGDDALAARQGRAATALLRLGHAEPVWRMLQREENAAARTDLIHDLAKFGVDPRAVISRLTVEPDAGARQALVLSLGEYAVDRIPHSERGILTAKLLSEYRGESDAGLHSAIDWLLRQFWGTGGELDRIDQEGAGRDAPTGRDWYVNRQGQTFSVVRGPIEFLMGSPDDERGWYKDEIRRRVRIDRTFAIATREVTVGQFARFLEQSPTSNRSDRASAVRRLSLTPRCPAVGTDWYDAARYCNWLSQQEGIPQSQWCYPPEIKEWMSLPDDCLNRTGYRLPTEAEWEYACRAGSTCSRPEGVSDALLSKYAKCRVDQASPHRHHEVGRLKPNNLGLFDMLGNVWEWTLDPFIDQFDGSIELAVRDEEPRGLVTNEVERVLRGGASDCNEPHYFRSATRNRHLPHSRYGSDGFRVARTVITATPLSLRTD